MSVSVRGPSPSPSQIRLRAAGSLTAVAALAGLNGEDLSRMGVSGCPVEILKGLECTSAWCTKEMQSVVVWVVSALRSADASNGNGQLSIDAI